VGGGFIAGAVLYYSLTLALEKKGAAVRYPTRFREYALERKQDETRQLIDLLSRCDFLRHLPAEEIQKYRPKVIFALWSIVLLTGGVAAAAGKLLIASDESLVAIFFQALAGGAVLALISHAMIPESIHDGGSLVVLPTVAGFLVALYMPLPASFV
jgi:hypothetical protein